MVIAVGIKVKLLLVLYISRHLARNPARYNLSKNPILFRIGHKVLSVKEWQEILKGSNKL